MGALLTNPDCVARWSANYPHKPGIALLKDYNAGTISGLQARQEIFESFRANGDMFWEGLATKAGFGCARRLIVGNDLIRVAGLTRHCPEALNYLGLCYTQQDPVVASQLFYCAAKTGHEQARNNLLFIRRLLPRLTTHMPRPLCAV